MSRRCRLIACLRGLTLGAALAAAGSSVAEPQWVGLWGRSPSAAGPAVKVQGTLRFRVHATLAGDQVRLRLSNEFGAAPLRVAGVTIAEADGPGTNMRPATARRFVFGGATSVSVPAGAPMLTDPLPFKIRRGADLVISLHLPGGFENAGHGSLPVALAPEAEALTAASLPGARPFGARPLVTRVELRTEDAARVVVALGDSITASIRTDVPGWPDWLSQRFEAAGGTPTAVLNAGISGNRVRISAPDAPWGESALARFDRDVLSTPGLTHVVVFEGINDLGLSNGGQGNVGEMVERPTPSADEMILAFRQLIARARAHGVKVIGATILPFEGAAGPPAAPFYTPAKEAVRTQVNAWIRSSGEFDGVIDFDAALRAPGSEPPRLRDIYEEPDHLHPSLAGQKALGEAVDLRLFDPR